MLENSYVKGSLSLNISIGLQQYTQMVHVSFPSLDASKDARTITYDASEIEMDCTRYAGAHKEVAKKLRTIHGLLRFLQAGQALEP